MVEHKIKAVGSRAQVMHGNAHHTSGGLTKSDLTYNKQGRIVSKRKQALGSKLYNKHKSVLKKKQFKPKTSHKKPKTSHKKPKTSHKKPKTSHKKPKTSHKKPKTSHKKPKTSHKK